MQLHETDTWMINSFWIQNILNVWFLTHNTLSDHEKLDVIVLLIT